MRSPNRTHDRQSFFKYMSAATANIVLTSHTLRWSSPILFNDPFDVPREMSFGLTSVDIGQALARRMAGLIEHPPENTADLEPRLRLIIDTVRKGIPPELKVELFDGLKATATSHRPTGGSMDALRAMWRTLLPDFRILCLTESPAHLAMWCHYADRYRGVVLELRCDDELDSAWLAAKPVTYPLAKPAVYTADGWAELLTLRSELAIRTMFDVAAFTKAPDWSYENEWRITSFKRPTDTGPFTDYKLHPKELLAVYLGPMIAATDRDAIVALTANYPDARVWNVSIGMSRELQFDTVGG
ncbi:MAG: DUF2971 domain-containing protein [Opitutaceae bacterium]